jgi:ferritin-like metal-binding protein YciE
MANSRSRASGMKPSAANDDTSLSSLFEHALKDMYYAEKKIYRSLPKMAKAAQSEELRTTLTEHREETAQQIERLEQIFEMIGKKARGERCDAIDGILEEGSGLLEDFGGTKAADAAIIFSCQAVEHYEITRYGSMAAFASQLGLDDAAALLEDILSEEKDADEKLSGLAESSINSAAAA